MVIGLGKLGGCEIDYGSDLDILFVTNSTAKELPKMQRLAVEIMELMSRRTEQGIVFHTDARLRPDGEKGLLVNTLGAYDEYYRRRAQLWEIQALTRTRPLAGDRALGEQFQKLAAVLTDFSKVGQASRRSMSRLKQKRGRLEARPALPLCFTPDWKKQIHQMRLRIEKERTPRGQDDLAIKTGKGGLMDAEFIAQTLCLENGWHEPNTLRALECGRDEKGICQTRRSCLSRIASCAGWKAFCAAGVMKAKSFCRMIRHPIIASPSAAGLLRRRNSGTRWQSGESGFAKFTKTSLTQRRRDAEGNRIFVPLRLRGLALELFALSRDLVKKHRGRGANVQRIHGWRHGNGHCFVARLQNHRRDAIAFAAEDEAAIAGKICLRQ